MTLYRIDCTVSLIRPITSDMKIQARFAVTLAPARDGVVWSTTYTGKRTQLLQAGIATVSQFPQLSKARSSSNGGHPESGRWYLWQELPQEDVWSITYYADGLFEDLDAHELRRLQRHLLNNLQITPETIGSLVQRWRGSDARKKAHPASGPAA